MPSTPSTFMMSTIEEGIKDRRAALFGRLVDDVHSAQLQRDRVVAVDIGGIRRRRDARVDALALCDCLVRNSRRIVKVSIDIDTDLLRAGTSLPGVSQ
jgi:hypothetical protein